MKNVFYVLSVNLVRNHFRSVSVFLGFQFKRILSTVFVGQVALCLEPSIFDEKLVVVNEQILLKVVLGCHSFHGFSVELLAIVEFEIPRMQEFRCCLLLVVEVVEFLVIPILAFV